MNISIYQVKYEPSHGKPYGLYRNGIFIEGYDSICSAKSAEERLRRKDGFRASWALVHGSDKGFEEWYHREQEVYLD